MSVAVNLNETITRVRLEFADGRALELDTPEGCKAWQDRVAAMEGMWLSRGWAPYTELPWKVLLETKP
jgi:hypothetical protein